ncbi:hypothetical protein TMEN_5869 [Trichophyton mentagrophytes]|nr:hypothetical protein TMEN_5869 [Trichophyton mentagrophytes]
MKECVLLSQQDLAHGKRSTWTGVDGCGSTDPSTHSARKTTSRTLAARYADSEGEGEQTLTSNEHRELIGVSSDDPTWEIRYPAYWGPADEETVVFLPIRPERSRQAGYRHGSSRVLSGKSLSKQAVFKYTLIQTRVENVWRELHILKARPYGGISSLFRLIG